MYFYKDCSDKKFRKIIGITWIIILCFEIYKQINFNLSIEDGHLAWHYAWYAFPFQFCSAPLYILPLIAFLPDSKVRDACISFTGTFAMFAGITVFVYPEQVFTTTIGINIQTLVHHGSQIVIGIFTLVHYRKVFNFKYFLLGILIFAGMSLIAEILNETFIYIIPEGQVFNMYYISRHFPSTLPILSTIYANTNYFVFLVLYLIGFSLCAFIMYLLFKGIYLLFLKKNGKNFENITE